MIVLVDGHKHHYEMECLTMMFFPGEKITTTTDLSQQDGDYLYTRLREGEGIGQLFVRASVGGTSAEEGMEIPLDAPDYDRQCERDFGRMVYRLLSAATGRAPKWGILTGIRPIKLFHQCVADGMTEEEIRQLFTQEMLLSPGKLDLAIQTQKNEQKVLSRSTRDSFSLYISIPFCPSRCHYCSFVSHSIDRAKKLMPEYVSRLVEELRYTAKLVDQIGIKLKTVYFGGGTPTTLTAEQLQLLIDVIKEEFDFSHLEEYTIEAGRPDTITLEKLQVIKNSDVTRISINPQTLNDQVLEAVGRRHTAKDVIDKFHMAREVGIDCINMDLIAGLPGDTLDSFRRSVDGLIALGPENITVHSLSVKRAADLAKVDPEFLRHGSLVSDMVDYSQRVLAQHDYHPYCLYRQKNTMDNLENVGYCRPGQEGLYNVYIMDENHSILAVGARGVTKLREPGGSKIQRVFNFKFPYEYLSRFDQVIARKDEVTKFYETYPF